MCASQESDGPPENRILVLRGPLQTLYDLLEEYAPTWYTKADHDSAASALRV
jgi:hypothetical protein